MLQMKQMVLLAVKGSKTLPDASDKCILPQSILEALLQGHAHGQLPSPLTFAVRSHAGRLTHVGVQEFDADEGTVVFPPVVLDNLGITASTRDGKDLRDVAAHQVTITHTILPKGEYVLLRPFASGYSLTTDWKTALEGAFRSAYTCLTKGDIVRLRGRSERFLVDALKPEDAQGVCIVDTDLEVDLTPLSDQHAQETLDANVQQEVAPPLVLGEQVAGSSTAQYTLSTWDRSAPLYISAQAEADAELVMDTHPEPTLHRHIWSDLRGCVRKTIDIFPGNTALQSSDTLYLSITGAHTLTVSQQRQPKTIPETHKQCPNCNEAIPAANLFLHERHCVRNTKRCAVCHQPHAITRPHQHCEVCGEVYEGSSAYHIERLHTPQTCTCGESFPNVALAAQHRATTCSLRLRVCQFCHLLLPQGDLSTLGYMDKERGFTPHEVECGARTIQCDVMGCRRLIKLKDVATHQRFHDSQRLTRNLPKVCANLQCVASVSDGNATLGLCATCYGPLHATTLDDAAQSGLWRRVQRRILLQLLSGCKRPGCHNTSACITANPALAQQGKQALAAQFLTRAKEDKAFLFCVSQGMHCKASVAEFVAAEGRYAEAWCRRAADCAISNGDAASSASIDAVHAWLQREAPSIAETA